MSTPTAQVASFFDVADFAGSRHARPVIDALSESETAPRVLISGNAGSGKTSVLRSAQRFLVDSRLQMHLLGPDTDVALVPSSSVLLVDDLHLLPEQQIDSLRRRAADPDAAIITTSRPWPYSPGMIDIVQHLERSRPAVVLGHVSRSDVLHYLEGADDEVSTDCLNHILQITGGVTWLVSAALAAHDERDCQSDGDHTALSIALQQSVAHRLSVVDADVRHLVETMSVASMQDSGTATDMIGTPEGTLAHAYAAGVLLRNGRPAPIVRAAVRANLTMGRLSALVTSLPGGVDASGDGTEWLHGVHDDRLSAALIAQADRVLEIDPAHARDLYDAAVRAGASSAELSAKRAQATWASGDVDAAAHLIDEAMSFPGREASVDLQLADVAATAWALRGMLRTGSLFYDASPPSDPAAAARAYVARTGAGLPMPDDADASADPSAPPSTMTVALTLLRRGLEGTLSSADSDDALANLVRASHLYTAAQAAVPMAETPAVIATIVAISCGELATARSVIDAAIEGHTGTPWMRSRLLLWRSWVSLQQARGAQARADLEASLEIAATPSPRDDMLVQAIRVGLARRYEDGTALAAAWRTCRSSLLETDVDLFMLLPLAELVTASARLGDDTVTRALLARALDLVDGLGSPAIWSTHLRWAGIQRGILLSQPESLASHAHALVATAETSPVAATMAKAGRLWTSVLAGSVEPDEVEAAAHALAAIGLTWDAARLASHGARRTEDRKVAARLLACARELHPVESTRAPEPTSATPRPAGEPKGTSPLSDREADVARLVVEGKTYAEIGETIFISPRTAEHHIASIRRRLGATSRSDLIAKLRVALDESEPTPIRNPMIPSAGSRIP